MPVVFSCFKIDLKYGVFPLSFKIKKAGVKPALNLFYAIISNFSSSLEVFAEEQHQTGEPSQVVDIFPY